jgi:hypothetical protein
MKKAHLLSTPEIVSDYIQEYRDRARRDAIFEIQRSPSAAIRKAALCELPSGKRHPHQRRIPGALLEQVEARLQGIGRKLASAANFAVLHRAVDEEIGGIKGIGALTVCDIGSPDRRSFREITRTRVFTRRDQDWRTDVQHRWRFL